MHLEEQVGVLGVLVEMKGVSPDISNEIHYLDTFLWQQKSSDGAIANVCHDAALLIKQMNAPGRDFVANWQRSSHIGSPMLSCAHGSGPEHMLFTCADHACGSQMAVAPCGDQSTRMRPGAWPCYTAEPVA